MVKFGVVFIPKYNRSCIVCAVSACNVNSSALLSSCPHFCGSEDIKSKSLMFCETHLVTPMFFTWGSFSPETSALPHAKASVPAWITSNLNEQRVRAIDLSPNKKYEVLPGA